MLFFEEPLGVAAANFVALRSVVNAAAVFAQLGLSLGEQAGSGDGAEEFCIIGSVGAPEFGYVPRDTRAYGDRPLNGRGRTAGLGGSVPQSGDPNIIGIPIPALEIFLQRIEG